VAKATKALVAFGLSFREKTFQGNQINDAKNYGKYQICSKMSFKVSLFSKKAMPCNQDTVSTYILVLKP
jgi:hypothetical protein